MTHARASRSHPLRRMALAAAVALSCTLGVAHADDYTDVNQLLKSGKYSEALNKADLYLAGKSRDPQMRFIKGVILTEMGRPADAVSTFQALTQDYPELPEPYNNLAALYAQQGQLDKARAALEMAVRINPKYALAQENLGDIYYRMADKAYGQALELASPNPRLSQKLTMMRSFSASPAPAARK